MDNKEQSRALQTPSEADRDKHMNYLASEEQAVSQTPTSDDDEEKDNDDESSVEDIRKKHDADSGNDGSTNQMLQHENLIDPGNEHNHITGRHSEDDENCSKKFDADAGGDGTGSMGANPGEQNNEDKE